MGDNNHNSYHCSEDPDHQDDGIKRPIDFKRVIFILECRRKVMEFTESMLEPGVTTEMLKVGEELICRGDYDSIVQERFIIKLCGYPLCQNKLTKEWNQKFHISLKDKKIYDVDQRKLFCSVGCMDSSASYRDEKIPEEPLWLRDGNNKKHSMTPHN